MYPPFGCQLSKATNNPEIVPLPPSWANTADLSTIANEPAIRIGMNSANASLIADR